VDNRVGTGVAHGHGYSFAVGEIRKHKPGTWMDRRGMPLDQVIEDGNLVACLDKPMGNDASDVARTTGN
jgi:hypothetical protein